MLRKRKEKGFALIELLITIVIMGILMGIAIPIILVHKDAADSSVAKANIQTVVEVIKEGLATGNLSNLTDPTGVHPQAPGTMIKSGNAQETVSPTTHAYINVATGDFCVSGAGGGQTWYINRSTNHISLGTECSSSI